MKLATLVELKAFLEITSTSSDALLSSILEYVSKRFETFCNREFRLEYRSKYYNVSDSTTSQRYFLSARPIDLTTISVLYNSVLMAINSDYYVWENEGIVEFYYPLTYSSPKQLLINYYGGYQDDGTGVLEVPDDLKYACVLQSAFIFRQRKNLGIQSLSLPDGSMNVMSPNDLLPDVKNILSSYRNYN